MAKDIPFFRSLNFKGLFSSKSTPKASDKTLAPTTSGRLRSILPVAAQRSSNGQPLRLMCSRLSTQQMSFRTTANVHPEESLELEFLLQGIGPLKVMAQVKTVGLAAEVVPEMPLQQSSLGNIKPIRSYSGQLELLTTRTQQEQILSYLCRQHEQARISSPA